MATSMAMRSARALAASPYLAHLRLLSLTDTQLGPVGAAALARTVNLPRLSVLTLYSNLVGNEGAKSLASGQSRRLRCSPWP